MCADHESLNAESVAVLKRDLRIVWWIVWVESTIIGALIVRCV